MKVLALLICFWQEIDELTVWFEAMKWAFKSMNKVPAPAFFFLKVIFACTYNP